MKKRLFILIVGILAVLGVSNAQTLTLSTEGDGTFGNGCLVPVDVYVDTEGEEIVSFDLMIKSSMKYLDFVPDKEVFDYFLYPVINKNGLIHIVGFSMDNVVRQIGKIGTLYFMSYDAQDQGFVELYFLGTGETIDTNLSNMKGVDVLKNINSININFVASEPSCLHNDILIEGGYANKNQDEVLDDIVKDIRENYETRDFVIFGFNGYLMILFIGVVIVLCGLIILLCKQKRYQGKND